MFILLQDSVILEKDGRQKRPTKYNWLCLFIVAQEAPMFMGCHVSGFCRFISCSQGRGYPCLAPEDIDRSSMYTNFLLLQNRSPQICQLWTNTHLLSHSCCMSESWALVLLGPLLRVSGGWDWGVGQVAFSFGSWHSFQSSSRLLAELSTLQL